MWGRCQKRVNKYHFESVNKYHGIIAIIHANTLKMVYSYYRRLFRQKINNKSKVSNEHMWWTTNNSLHSPTNTFCSVVFLKTGPVMEWKIDGSADWHCNPTIVMSGLICDGIMLSIFDLFDYRSSRTEIFSV